jgi:hypothetical protein
MTFMITLNTKEQHRVQVHFFKGTFSPAGWVQGGEASIVCIEPWHEHSHPIMIKRVP